MALFASYRIDQFADPEGFKTSLGAVLEQYENDVITYVCDPRTGIQRRLKWPPSISEMVGACEDYALFLAKQRAAKPVFKERKPEPLFRQRPQGYMAQVFVPEGHHRYDSMEKRAQVSDPIWWRYGNSSDGRSGIWVSHNFWNNAPDTVNG